MQFEWQLAWAYWRGRRSNPTGNGFISFIALLSVLGIALGVAALITVLSVMNGFQKEVRNRMLSVVSHLELHLRAEPQSHDPKVRQTIAAHPEILGIAPFEPMQVLRERTRHRSERPTLRLLMAGDQPPAARKAVLDGLLQVVERTRRPVD